MKIIKNKNLWFIFSGILVLSSLLLWISVGLKQGIDFTGGSLLEVKYNNTQRPAQSDIVGVFEEQNIAASISSTGEDGYIIRFGSTTEEVHQNILQGLQVKLDAQLQNQEYVVNKPTVEEMRFDAIGPVIGKELKQKSFEALFLVVLGIILYIAYAFRKVSYPISSWKYGVVAIITLIHDVLITLGFFVLLGKYLGWEVNTPFIAALLTILGYSVNDTIVVFDRIRENLHKVEGTFEEVVEKSVNDTMQRSLNTSMTTLLVLIAVFIFGGSTIHSFVAALIIGISFGTYSSIFIASPLLVIWQQIEWKLKKGRE